MATLKSQSGNKEKQFVAKFLSFMHAERGTNYPEMMKCISPNYLKENNIDLNTHKVNNYSIWGFTIESYYAEENLITVKIFGQKHAWAYRLTFKLSNENERLYILPSSFDDEWIHPWWSSESVKP